MVWPFWFLSGLFTSSGGIANRRDGTFVSFKVGEQELLGRSGYDCHGYWHRNDPARI